MKRYCPLHLHVCGVHVHKTHVKAFLAVAGFALMGADWAITFANIHHLEPIAGPGGKLGATMAGAVPFFEGLLRPTRSLA